MPLRALLCSYVDGLAVISVFRSAKRWRDAKGWVCQDGVKNLLTHAVVVVEPLAETAVGMVLS